jgi:hypothetical protein
VRNEDLERANIVLKDVSLYSIDDNNQLIKCPNCGEEQVEMETEINGLKSLLKVVFLGAFALLFTKYKYKCQNCKSEFN